MTDLAVIATLLAAAAGGTLAGRTAVALDAQRNRVATGRIARSTWTAGAAGVMLTAAALPAAPAGLAFAGAVALAVGAFAVAFVRGAVRIVVTEERRERAALRTVPRRRAASRRRPAA